MSGKNLVKKFHDGLFRDILFMLKDAKDHDVVIYVGENQKEFLAHSSFLKARSEYFKTALSDKWITKKNNLIEFKKPNINPTVFEIILEYIYTGKMCLTNQTGENILGLIVASGELLFDELFMYLQDYMIKYQFHWIQRNLVLVLHTVSKIPKCEKLRKYCIQFILNDPQILIVSKKFLSLDEDILSELLKRDDLEIEEISIWNYLIKWGIEQTTGLESKNSDRAKWNDENYEALKETLSKIIPLIRFSEISSADFFDKVYPFMAVIPNHIYEEVLEFYMKGTLSKGITALPPRVGTIDIESNIISSKQAYVIANLIDKKDATTIRKKNDLKYKFELRYHYRSGSRNFNNDAINEFRNMCERRQEPCVILVNKSQYTFRNTYQETNSQNLKKIYGEYNSFTPQNENFIFCFENENDIKNTKINRNTNTHIYFNKDSNGQIVRVTMLDCCNGNFSVNDDDFTLKEVEVYTVNVNK